MSEVKKVMKKPIAVEAMQWDGTNQGASKIVSWVLSHGEVASYTTSEHTIDIPTLEGVMSASPGWWIFRGVGGEFYPVKPEVFDKSYDILESVKEE